MKRLFTLLLILISFSFSQEPINYETTLIERNSLFYTKDTNKPYSGPVFTLYEDGKRKEEGKGEDIAIMWEGNNPNESATFTYNQLLDKVSSFSFS